MTGRRRRQRRPPAQVANAARLTRSRYHEQRQALLAALRADDAVQRRSAFAALSVDYSGRMAAARLHYQGSELTAALQAIRQEQQAAEAALEARLATAARTRRRTLLGALRAKRIEEQRQFRAAASHSARGTPPPTATPVAQSTHQRHAKKTTRRTKTRRPRR